MMDLWHCHKPDEHHLHDHHGPEGVGSGKGYAAGAKLVARKEVGFVDVLGLLVFEEDVEGAEVSHYILFFILQRLPHSSTSSSCSAKRFSTFHFFLSACIQAFSRSDSGRGGSKQGQQEGVIPSTSIRLETECLLSGKGSDTIAQK